MVYVFRGHWVSEVTVRWWTKWQDKHDRAEVLESGKAGFEGWIRFYVGFRGTKFGSGFSDFRPVQWCPGAVLGFRGS